jgi:tetratricopeptide (TPR) repeat protein
MNSVAVYELDIASIEELPADRFPGIVEIDLLDRVTSTESGFAVTAGLYSTWETSGHFRVQSEPFLQCLRNLDPNARLVWAGRLERRIERNGYTKRAGTGLERSEIELLNERREIDRRLSIVETKQLEAENKSKEWSRSDTISVVSIAVSATVAIWALWLTSSRTQDQTRHDLMSDLRAVIQRLQAIPKEMNEIAAKFPDQNQGAPLIENLKLERAELARQAANILDRIPMDVSGIECEAICRVLFEFGFLSEAERVLNHWSRATANSGSSALPLIYTRAQLEFLRGHDEGGRSLYRQALELAGSTADDQHWQGVHTELRWAESETIRRNWKQVVPHFKGALAHVKALPIGQAQADATHWLLVQELGFAHTRFRDNDWETATQALNAALIEADPKVRSDPRLIGESNEEAHIAWAELAITNDQLKEEARYHFLAARRLSQQLNGHLEDRRFKTRLENLGVRLGLPPQSQG